MKPCGAALTIENMDNTNNEGGNWMIALAILIFFFGWVALILYINSLV
jgi:hypothetical protein